MGTDRLQTDEIFRLIASRAEFDINGNFPGKDIVSIEQFSRADIETVMQYTALMEEWYKNGEPSYYSSLLMGREVVVNFAQPSTRTYTSFVLAAQRLGATVVGIPDAKASSSFAKDETIEDTALTYQSMGVSAIVMRHPDDDSTLRAALAVHIPIISGGSGKLEHPTQALLDLYTILKETGKRSDELSISFVGDLKNGRTVHSLVKVLEKTGAKNIYGVSPSALSLPESLVSYLNLHGVSYTALTSVEEAVEKSDVIYMTRMQKEHMCEGVDHKAMANEFKLTLEMVRKKDGLIIMHPLPRNDELPPELDKYEGSAYFRQVEYGVFVRMALLALVLARN